MDETVHLLNRESFIIRLWQRELDLTRWVGQVQHVSSGKLAVIHDLQELTAVIETLLAETAVTQQTTDPK